MNKISTPHTYTFSNPDPKMRTFFYTLSIILITTNIKLHAQEPDSLNRSGILQGYIRAQNGKYLSDVTIKIKELNIIGHSGNGMFYFKNIPKGRYSVEFLKEGYRTTIKTLWVGENGWPFYDIMLISKNKREFSLPYGKEIILTWRKSPEPDVVGYIIYRSKKPIDAEFWKDIIKIAEIKSPTDTTFIDSCPQIGDNYYAVTAVDSSGLESRYSSQVYYYVAGPSKFKLYACGGAVSLLALLLIVFVL